ncbi:MAG TPA: phytanoyl-CoA dioxygenase family protein [Caulobacteraceae bacterium]
MNGATRDEHVAQVRSQGFTIVQDAIEPAFIDTLSAALERIERELGAKPAGNTFEGAATVRIYNLLAHGSPFDKIPVHASVLPIVEGVLDSGCLISSLSSIAIDSGEIAQPIHADDMVIPLEKPHAPIVCNSMWALTDFTAANGATRLVPGSHFGPNPNYGGTYETIAAEMPKGSVLIWDGALWHGGGANTTGERRVGLAMNYCAGFIRQQENQQLGIPLEVVRGFSPRLQELAGFGVYRGLIGHIDKDSPSRRLFSGGDFNSIWDR